MTSTDTATSSDLDHKLALYRSQVELRQFENRAYDLFLENYVKGTSHLAVGQEAIAAGFAKAMRPTDWTFATYRGHDHTLARGVPMTAVFAELMGRTNGLMAGKGGSMHLTSVEHGVMGSYAIIGAHLPIACGAAWSAQYRGTDQVALCFFGDGTTNIGAFHEALNLAAVWKLPVVFVCENNLWMEYTRTTEVTAVPNPAADRASAYGLPSILVDGNDADVVYLAVGALSRQPREYQDRYWDDVVGAIGARRVLPIHWDDFSKPLSRKLVPLPYLVDNFAATLCFLDSRAAETRIDVRIPQAWVAVDPFTQLSRR